MPNPILITDSSMESLSRPCTNERFLLSLPNEVWRLIVFVRFCLLLLSSFLPLNLSGAFLEDGPKEFNKTLGYDRPTYLVVHPCLCFYSGLANHIFWGVKGMWGLTLNPMGKILNSIVIGYNLKTLKDIDMRSSESFTECYRQYSHDVRCGPWDQPHPQGMGNC